MKNNMSHGEQEIYFSLQPGKVYDLGFIRETVHTKKSTILILLSRMVKKGWLTRLKRGVYQVNFPDSRAASDQFQAALDIFGGYLGFSSALYVYGAMDEYPSTIYVCTASKSVSKVLGENAEIKAVAMGRRATGMIYFNGYFVSSKGKTLYDCFHIPKYSGGYSNILSAVPRLKLDGHDWDMFLFYIKRFGDGSFSRKIGFMLELLNNAVEGAVPPGLLKKLNIGKQTVKLGEGYGGKFIKRWGLVNYMPEKDLLGKITYG